MSKADELDIEVGRMALRTFNIGSDDTLRSVFQRYTWEQGVAVATCLHQEKNTKHQEGEEAPAAKCVCGIYGHLDLDRLAKDYRDQAIKCVAVIAAEGITYIGSRGLRTAAARIVAYWTAPSDSGEDMEGPFWRHGDGDLRKVAAKAKQVFEQTCPEAKYFSDIDEMLAAYKFPARKNPFLPIPPDPPAYAHPNSMYRKLAKLANHVGRWEDVAAHMTAATPAGIAAVKYILEGKYS